MPEQASQSSYNTNIDTKGVDLSWRMDSPCSAESTEESAKETDGSKYEHVEKLQAVNQLLTDTNL